MILYCSKKTISIYVYICLPVCPEDLSVSSCLRPIEALDNPQASTIRGNWPKISPRWASCVGCLVGCVPHFLGFLLRPEGKGNIGEKCCFVCFWGERSLWAKMVDGILLEMKWMWLGGSDGVSVGGGHWRCCAKKNEVWSLEIGKPFRDVEGPQKSAWETPTCGYLWWWCLRTWEIQGIGMDWVDSRPD